MILGQLRMRARQAKNAPLIPALPGPAPAVSESNTVIAALRLLVHNLRRNQCECDALRKSDLI